MQLDISLDSSHSFMCVSEFGLNVVWLRTPLNHVDLGTTQQIVTAHGFFQAFALLQKKVRHKATPL